MPGIVSSQTAGIHHVGIETLQKNWGWILALGIALIALGTVAVGSAALMTIASVLFFGWLLIIGGVLEVGHAFWRKAWGGFFIDMLGGILHVVVGFMLVANPAASAVALTLLISMFLIIGGIFRLVTCLAMRVHHWPWLALHGVVNLALGIMIWRQWPVSGLWVIGLFIGIDLLFNGWSLVMLGLSARNLRVGPETSPASG